MPSKIKVTATKQGVTFSIDHQGFSLKVPEHDPEETTAIAYHRWYARQLRIALRRLGERGLATRASDAKARHRSSRQR